MAIVLRNIVFFFLWFMWAGAFNILPQVFFLTYYPEGKIFFVTLLLFLGAIFSMAGVWSSHGDWFLNRVVLRRQRPSLIALFVMTGAFFLMLFAQTNLIIYFLFFILFRYFSGYLYNHLDQFYVNSINKAEIQLYVQSNILYQLLGVMLAPLYFSFFYGSLQWHIAIISVLLMVSLVFAFMHLRRHSMRPIRVRFPRGHIFELMDKIFIGYTLLIFAFFSLFPASAIYALRDYYGFENAARLGGIIISLTILVTFLVSMARSLSAGKYRLHSVLYLVLTLYLVAVAVIYLRLSYSILYLMLFSLMAGIGSGIYLVWSRTYATYAKINRGQSHLLTLYNDMPDFANIAVFGLILPLSFLKGADSSQFFQILFLGSFAIFSLALFLALVYASRVFGRNSG